MSVRACVLIAPGINCHRETAYALEAAGAAADFVHINELREGQRRLASYAIFAASGGFSHGDHIAAGRLLGIQLRTELAEDLTRFLEDGKFIVGICNGFQALVESGLLPGGVIDGNDRRSAALAPNKEGGFHCAWKNLRVEDSACRYASPEILGETIELQVAHGEGRYLMQAQQEYYDLAANKQVVFRYIDDNGVPTAEFPANPNGSPLGITGVTDPSGQVLGMMPHPERSVEPNRPHYPFGARLFEQMVNLAKEM